MNTTKRIGVASLIQETNTFSLQASTYADFESQGLWRSDEIIAKATGLNLEISGAIERLNELDLIPVPIIRAWAMSGGVLDGESFQRLRDELRNGLILAGELDGVILNLHGALVAEGEFQCDARFVEDVRELLGADLPIVVTHDLHANVGQRIVATATAVIGYKTYPHIDQGDTGARAAELMAIALEQPGNMKTVLEKVNMLIPAEIQPILEYPMQVIRALADTFIDSEIVDISLFPVQPWLDVPELGFGFSVTHVGTSQKAHEIGRALARALWNLREEFKLSLVTLNDAIDHIHRSNQSLPYLLVQSADAPPGGATGDSPDVLAALLAASPPINSVMTLVDENAVHECFESGINSIVEIAVGSSIDRRWSDPLRIAGTVTHLSTDAIVLTGPVMTGQEVSMGKWATVDTGSGVHVLLTERPAPTFDPAVYTQTGFDLAKLQAIQVRSCALFRSGFAGLFHEALILDLPGATTPNLNILAFHNIPRPMFPLDSDISELEDKYSHSL